MSYEVSGCLSGVFTSEVSWGVICQNIRTIAFHWYEKKKLEVAWIGSGENLISEDTLAHLLMEGFKEGLTKKDKPVKDFESYKNFVLSIAENTLTGCFMEYLSLLDSSHQKAWKVFTKVIRIRCLRWLVKNPNAREISHEDAFGEGMKRFYEKYKTEGLEFENSYKLKSYFFKIVDLILKEDFRKIRRLGITETTDINLHEWQAEESEGPGEYDDEEFYILNKGIASLNKQEKMILHGLFYEEKKLKEIAMELNISEENCRVIKFRAMNKLKGLLKEGLK